MGRYVHLCIWAISNNNVSFLLAEEFNLRPIPLTLPSILQFISVYSSFTLSVISSSLLSSHD